MSNIYEKLDKVRAAIKKEGAEDFKALLELVNRKCKYHKVLPLYCFYDDMATLSIVDMDEITAVVKFQVPVSLVGVRNAKEYLYNMAFDVETIKEEVTLKQYQELVDLMKERKVTEKEILERYKLERLTDITPDIYERCLRALSRVQRQQP